MINYIINNYIELLPFLNVFNYITVKSSMAMLTALIIGILFGGKCINVIKTFQSGKSTIRNDTPETHLKKEGTPTMGGLIILGSAMISSLIWVDFSNMLIWIVLLVTLGFGFIGFVDDVLNLKKEKKGLSEKHKMLSMIVVAIFAVFLYKYAMNDDIENLLTFPILKNFVIDLGVFFVPFAVFVIVGTSNAVNLTDGLDGLVTVPIIIALVCMAIIIYFIGNAVYAKYLQYIYVKDAAELTVFIGALIGGSIGFLWYNAPPAKIFMGDTGSLALGGALGTVAVIVKQEILLIIIGGVFVVEALSVIIQVFVYKKYKKRVFLMAPLHHHFEKKGIKETQIVIRCWIISFVLAVIAIALLKLR